MAKKKTKAALGTEAQDGLPRAQITLTDEAVYVTRFDARGAPTATYPVLAEDVARAWRGMEGARLASGVLPLDAVYWERGKGGAERLAIYLPPAIYEMTLAIGRRPTRVRVPMPGLVWMGKGQNYWLVAVLERPTNERTRLCRAPVPNVHTDGLVCQGQVNFPACKGETIHAAARLFWESGFNNDLSAGKIQGDDNLLGFLKGLAGRRSFPNGKLSEMTVNLGAWLERCRA